MNPTHLIFREIKLKASKKAPEDVKLPFTTIKVIDSRFDTTKMGFVPTDENFVYDRHHAFRKLKCVGGVAKPLEDYYNDYYSKAFEQNGFELMIVMKKFWISAFDYTKKSRIGLANNSDINTNLYCKWEYYIGKNGRYIPAKRLDTIMRVSSKDSPKDNEGDFEFHRVALFKTLLKHMIERYDFEKNLAGFESQSKKTMEEICRYNEKRNDAIVLKDSVLKKGVYLSFEGFKNNQPSITDFKEEKTHYRLIDSERYLTDLKGNLIGEYWGYSDGEVFRYGKFGNDRIFRIGNTFEFFVQVMNTNTNNSGAMITKEKNKIWFPYQIDMETGLIY